MRNQLWSSAFMLIVGSAACQAPPEAPDHPTWADVQPILQGECNHCHGATAKTTGSVGSIAYRFDFYDMNDVICGDAAQAMALPVLALSAAKSIKADLTNSPGGGRPKMPPAPGAVLEDWERDTVMRWADQPVKGPPSPGNHRPNISINELPSASANGQLSFIATIDDIDNDSVIGVIKLGDRVFKMDHPGSFAVKLDLTGMPAGSKPLQAILCDGWGNATFDLGPVVVKN